MTHDQINAILDERDVANKFLAEMLGISEDKVSKSRSPNGVRQWQPKEIPILIKFLKEGAEPDLPNQIRQAEYVAVEVLPTYAGMGGGGTGDGDRETALVSRTLIEHELRGKADDFLLINVRGDSMEPDFYHGDQLLVDKRDKSPSQPGPFALWDGEWGEYVVKNVERLPEGRVRMFSSNLKYTPAEVLHEETQIVGRPVWFGRRL